MSTNHYGLRAVQIWRALRKGVVHTYLVELFNVNSITAAFITSYKRILTNIIQYKEACYTDCNNKND